jgi:hypothetical protein
MPLFNSVKQAVVGRLVRRLPPCEEITRLISASMDRRLSVRERITLRLHLWICVWCARYLEQVHFLRATLRQHAEHLKDEAYLPDGEPSATASLSPEARARIRRALSDE